MADFTFATSSTQGDFHRTYEVEVDRMVGPILAGPAFAIMGGLAAFAVAFVVTRRSRRRLRGVAQP